MTLSWFIFLGTVWLGIKPFEKCEIGILRFSQGQRIGKYMGGNHGKQISPLLIFFVRLKLHA